MTLDSIFRHVERREKTKSIKSVNQNFLNVEIEADRHRKHYVWETLVGYIATAVSLRVAARLRAVCYEASHQRQNEWAKQTYKTNCGKWFTRGEGIQGIQPF
eukprot:6193980-Pleurochrysis_carterae.AAC.3